MLYSLSKRFQKLTYKDYVRISKLIHAFADVAYEGNSPVTTRAMNGERSGGSFAWPEEIARGFTQDYEQGQLASVGHGEFLSRDDYERAGLIEFKMASGGHNLRIASIDRNCSPKTLDLYVEHYGQQDLTMDGAKIIASEAGLIRFGSEL